MIPFSSSPPSPLAVPTGSIALLLFCFLAGNLATENLAAESATNADDHQMRFFENRIRPLLVARCYECHAADNAEGGLRLDVANTITEGGDSGAAVVPGKPEESLLVSAIRYEELEMPPDQPLSAREQADIVKWIQQGAYWPISHSLDQAGGTNDEAWWAAEPIDPGPIPPPSPNSLSQNVIDRYVDRKLEEAGLYRAPPADRRRLMRRLSYDLLGLPPTPQAIERFVNDDRPDAYTRLVDSMFANSAYGERMGRLWLDLVRYAESDGWRADAYRPQAWRYRQFVVDAFNAGMPYNDFVALQLAGDELQPGNERAMAAAGFMRLGIYEYNQRDAEGQWQNIVDEITDVTADVFLATGMACAKCHDHKFDPIPRADYFRMRSVFEPLSFEDWNPQKPKPDPATQAEIDRLLAELKAIEGDAVRKLGEAVVDKFPLSLQAMYRKPPEQRTTYEQQMAYLVKRQYLEEGLAGNKLRDKIGKEAYAKREAVLAKLDALDANPYEPAHLMTIADASGEVRPTRLPGRSSGRAFEPGAPTVFGGFDFEPVADPDSSSTGRRSALAKWITSPDNPITARVIVNRLWQYHFGVGLVSSPNDFGRLGTPPSHPGLLDSLASELVRSGWDLQAIQRRIVHSETYKQSSRHPLAETAMNIDAGNRLLWHKSVRRLDAEQYRDSLLVAMDSLIPEFGGPSITGTEGRRSIYMRRMRNTADEMLAALDAPPGIVGTAKRDVTTTATQSLMMMNSSRLLSVAKKFAARVRRDLATDQTGESTTDKTVESSKEFVRHAHYVIAGIEADHETIELLAPLAASGVEGQIDACHILLNSNAFLFID